MTRFLSVRSLQAVSSEHSDEELGQDRGGEKEKDA